MYLLFFTVYKYTNSKNKTTNEMHEIDDKVSFMLTIPFFSHWFKKKVRTLMQTSKTQVTNKG